MRKGIRRFVFKFAFVASEAWGAILGLSSCVASKTTHRGRWALEMAARARSEPQGRSKLAARRRWGVRSGRSSSFRRCWGARNVFWSPSELRVRNDCSIPARLRWNSREWLFEFPRLCLGARNVRRARSASPERSTCAYMSSSSPLGLAGALDMAVPACAATLGQSKSLLRPARSASPGSSTTLFKLHAKKLFENAVVGSRLALDTWLCSSMLQAWIS